MSREKSDILVAHPYDQLLAARGKTVLDVIAPGLDVIFCGINKSPWRSPTPRSVGNPDHWPVSNASRQNSVLLL